MREIEPKIIRSNDRARLFDMTSEDFLQSRMYQMGSRMVPPRSVALFGVNDRNSVCAHGYCSFFHLYLVNNQPGQRRIGIYDSCLEVNTARVSGWIIFICGGR